MTNGVGPGDAADGQVTVPPAGQEQRLPIFDSLESDWFRRSGKTLTTTQRAQGAQAAQPAGRAGFVDVARRRRLARGPGSGVARGRRNNHGRAAEAGSEG